MIAADRPEPGAFARLFPSTPLSIAGKSTRPTNDD